MHTTTSLRLALLTVSTAIGTACSSSNGAGPGGPDGGGVDAADAAASDSGNAGDTYADVVADVAVGDTGNTGNDGGAWTPPPTRSACAVPTATAGTPLMAQPSQAFASPVLGWSGSEGALAYATGTFGGTWSIVLQRESLAGMPMGTAVSLGSSTVGGQMVPRVALAADATEYVACWDGAGTGGTSVQCATAPVGSGSATMGASVTGQSPSLARGAPGWALAYAVSGTVSVQILDEHAAAQGSAQAVPSLGNGSAILPSVAATASAFAVSAAGTGSTVNLQRLDATGAPAGSAVALTSNPITAVALAAVGDMVGATWVDPSQVSARLVDATGTATALAAISSATFGGGYGKVSAAAGSDSFAFTWSGSAQVIYRAVDHTGMPLGMAVAAADQFWDDNAHSIVPVTDGFLLVTTYDSSADTLHVVHLGCP